jgi:hypothetical protein
LLLERLGLQEFPHDHVIHVDQFVLVRQVAFKQFIDSLDDLVQTSLLFLLNALEARLLDRFQLSDPPGLRFAAAAKEWGAPECSDR